MEFFEALPGVDTAKDELDVMVAIEKDQHKKARANEYISQRGVKFKIQKVNAFLVTEALGKVKWPDIPVLHNDEDDRDEENPNDPIYLQKLQGAQALRVITSYNMSIAMGTYTQRDWCPEGIDYVDGTEWQELMEYAGVEIPNTRLARYVAWVKYYILVDHDELNELMKIVATYAGFVHEEEVAEAIESFPDSPERSDDQPALDTE